MPANECIPYKFPGDALTFKAKGAVTGKTLLKVGGNRTGGGGGGAEGSTTLAVGLSSDGENLYQLEVCGAGERAVGVAAWDVADKAEGKWYRAGTGIILPVTCSEAITAGWLLESTAEGKVKKYVEGAGKNIIGVAMDKTSGTGKDCEVALF